MDHFVSDGKEEGSLLVKDLSTFSTSGLFVINLESLPCWCVSL